MKFRGLLVVPLAFVVGCAGFSWKSPVPQEKRTVFVPVFRNGSEITGIGDVMARQLSREFQREGTFKLARSEEAAYELQGEVVSVSGSTTLRGRYAYSGYNNGRLTAKVKLTIIDRQQGAVVVANREYVGQSDYLVGEDTLTAQRDASGRLAEEVARQIVDDLASGKFAPMSKKTAVKPSKEVAE